MSFWLINDLTSYNIQVQIKSYRLDLGRLPLAALWAYFVWSAQQLNFSARHLKGVGKKDSILARRAEGWFAESPTSRITSGDREYSQQSPHMQICAPVGKLLLVFTTEAPADIGAGRVKSEWDAQKQEVLGKNPASVCPASTICQTPLAKN